jgi:eukaryotic-like serine/threonine-protein kinase
MTPERWQKVKEIFHAASERTAGEREAFVASACSGDHELRRQVESLLVSSEKDGGFIDAPAYEVAAELLADPKSELKRGQTIGSYEIDSFISRGGMGEVYLAHDRRLGRKVALKILPSTFTRNQERLRRFEQEARSASALNHPNIITIYEVLKSESTHLIATEFVEGVTLRHRVSQSPLELSEALTIAIQVADALSAAHKAGIVHRDIKPENIMLRPDGYVKVLDFGLAKLAEQPSANGAAEAPTMQVRTGSGVVMGTAGYMSPEQARGKEVDARSDIFSLGAVLYEMVGRRKPFEGETPSDTLAAILKSEPPPISELKPETPGELVRIINKTLRKDREERYQFVKELLIDLRALKQELDFAAKSGSRHPSYSLSVPAISEAPVTPQTTEVKHAISTITNSLSIEMKRHKLATAAGIAIVVLAIAGAVYFLPKILRGSRTHFASTKITQLTNSGKVIDVTITPDGRYILYTLSDARKQSVWIRQVSTANDKVVVPPADVGLFGITVSRDGNDLYYVIKQNLDRGTLYRVPIFGGTPVKILEALDGPVSFSPDGKRMVLVRGNYPGEGESALVIANADGTNEQILARRKRPEGFSPLFFTGPSWSPDGELIAASVFKTGAPSRVIGFRVKDGKEQDLTTNGLAYMARVEWLRDMSGFLLIGGNSTADSQVWFVSYPDGTMRQLTNDLDQHRDVGLPEAADKFVTVVSRGLVNIWVVPEGDAKRAVQLPVGNLSFYGSYGNSVNWTPDGRIVFSSNESSSVDVWIMDADGGNRRQLTSNAGRNAGAVVSPDGRHIVFTSTRSGSPAIWRTNIDGSNPTQLTHGTSDVFPSFSPDGKWVVYTSVGSKPTIWRVAIEGGEPRELTSHVSIYPLVSPDGKFIAYLYPDSSDPFAPPNRIALIPFEGGEPVKTFEFVGPIRVQAIIEWSPDGKSIEYSATIDNASNVWSQPLEGGPPKKITDFKDGLMSGFSWSPDGKTLACSRGIQLRDAVIVSEAK